MSGSSFGEMLDRSRKQHAKAWKRGLFLFLGVLVAVNLFIHPHHGEYGPDIYPGFWELFGFLATVGMIFLMKKIIQPMLAHPEESDDE